MSLTRFDLAGNGLRALGPRAVQPIGDPERTGDAVAELNPAPWVVGDADLAGACSSGRRQPGPIFGSNTLASPTQPGAGGSLLLQPRAL